MFDWFKSLFIDKAGDLKKPSYRRKDFFVISYHIANWTSEGVDVSTCSYTTLYYPHSHTVKLFYDGWEPKNHPYYRTVVLPKFYHLQNILPKYTREQVLDFMAKNPITEQSSKKDTKKDSADTIEALEQRIKKHLKKEEYEKVADLQKEIERLEAENSQ